MRVDEKTDKSIDMSIYSCIYLYIRTCAYIRARAYTRATGHTTTVIFANVRMHARVSTREAFASGSSTPYTPFDLICTIHSEQRYFPICTTTQCARVDTRWVVVNWFDTRWV